MGKTLICSEKRGLFATLKTFVSKSKEELIIIAPYIKVEVLKILLSKCSAKKVTIITTWKLRDLQFGSSDLEIYTFCKEKGYYFFLNQRVHLKAIINNYDSCIFGSANVSNTGLALIDNFNYELMGEIDKLNVEDVLYFKKILKESVKVNDALYLQFKQELEELEPLKEIKEINIEQITLDKNFLISALPMSKDIEKLYKIYSGKIKSETKEERDCALHDIVLYNLPNNLSKEKFIKYLKKSFFDSKFISKLIPIIDENGMYFGRVKEWIQKNCTDVPIPSRRDLTGNIQVLYEWIKKLSDGKYKVDRPNYSERIYKIK